MIMTIQNKEIHFDNDKVIIIYTDRYNNMAQMEQEDYRQQMLICSIKNKNYGINYLSTIWKTNLKNINIKKEDIKIQLIDNDENSNIILDDVSRIEYKIEIVNNQIEEFINIYR